MKSEHSPSEQEGEPRLAHVDVAGEDVVKRSAPRLAPFVVALLLSTPGDPGFGFEQ